MTECFEHSPVAWLVGISGISGIGQRRSGYLAANPDVMELGALRVQTGHQATRPPGHQVVLALVSIGLQPSDAQIYRI